MECDVNIHMKIFRRFKKNWRLFSNSKLRFVFSIDKLALYSMNNIHIQFIDDLVANFMNKNRSHTFSQLYCTVEPPPVNVKITCILLVQNLLMFTIFLIAHGMF